MTMTPKPRARRARQTTPARPDWKCRATERVQRTMTNPKADQAARVADVEAAFKDGGFDPRYYTCVNGAVICTIPRPANG